MYMLNRAAALIKFKKPYVDWANSIPGAYKVTVERMNRENHVYLLPEHDTPQALELIIQDLYRDIFEIELCSWSKDESQWPKERDYQTFLDWFDVQVHSMVLHPYEEEIEEEEFLYG